MDNIPKGYDENGVRGGVGKWEDGIWGDEIECEDIGGVKDLFEEDKDVRENLEMYDEEQAERGANPKLVECMRCGAMVDEDDSSPIDYGTGHICQRCADDMDIY